MNKDISDHLVDRRVKKTDNTLGLCIVLITGFAVVAFLARLGDKPIAVLAVESVVGAGVFGLLLWAIASHWYREAWQYERSKEEYFDLRITGTAKGDTGRQSLNDLRNKLLQGSAPPPGISISREEYRHLQAELNELQRYREQHHIKRLPHG